MNIHGANNTNVTFNIANIEEIRAKVRAMQAEVDRSQTSPNLRDMAIDMGELSYATAESQIAAWEAEFGFNATLNSLDYNDLHANDVSRLVTLASLQLMRSDTFVFDTPNRRDLNEMTRVLEEKLESIDSNTDISEERRALERSLWEEGFVRALSTYHRGQRTAQGDAPLFVTDRAAAESNAETAIHFALGVMQNVESISSNTDIQSLIIRGMEEFVNRNINIGFMLPRNNGAQSEDAFRELLVERNAFRSSTTEMFETLRAQMQSGERQFPLVQGIDVHA